MNSYSCSSCGTSFDEQAPLVMTAMTRSFAAKSVTVTCQHPGCWRSVTRPSLQEALAAMGEMEEKK